MGPFSLERRLTRGDLIQAFKIVKGIDNVECDRFFQLVGNSRTRGNSLKLRKPQARLRSRNEFFNCRVVNAWNALDENVVAAPSVTSFKKRLDAFTEKQGS